MRHALFLLLLAACESAPARAPDLATPPGDGGAPDSSFPIDLALSDLASDLAHGDLAHPRLAAQTIPLTLDAGVFTRSDSHPSALVYIPSGFDPTPPLHVVVYIHGFDNCVTNIVRDAGGTCSDGGVTRNAYALAAQLEESGKNALFLAPEVAFEQATGNPGALSDPARFRALLSEVLDDLAPVIGARTVDDVGEIIVASHSGGYTAADDITNKSDGITAREVWMFDSLYSSTVTSDFESWAKQDLGSFYAPYRRFCSFYTVLSGCQGTDCNSQAMADSMKALYPPDAGVVVDDRQQSTTWTDDQYRHGFLYKWSSLAHDQIPRYYFVRMLRTSGLPDKP